MNDHDTTEAAAATGEDGAGGAPVRVHASRTKASMLMLLGAFVVVAFSGVDWFRGLDNAFALAAVVFGLMFAGYFVAFAMALFFRRAPVFAVDMNGIAMPVGILSTLDLSWHEVESYAIVTRPIRWMPGVSSRAFGVTLTPEAFRRRDLDDAVLRECRLNRASMGVDLVLTHWFCPVSFEEVRAHARRFRPGLDATPWHELGT